MNLDLFYKNLILKIHQYEIIIILFVNYSIKFYFKIIITIFTNKLKCNNKNKTNQFSKLYN